MLVERLSSRAADEKPPFLTTLTNDSMDEAQSMAPGPLVNERSHVIMRVHTCPTAEHKLQAVREILFHLARITRRQASGSDCQITSPKNRTSAAAIGRVAGELNAMGWPTLAEEEIAAVQTLSLRCCTMARSFFPATTDASEVATL